MAEPISAFAVYQTQELAEQQPINTKKRNKVQKPEPIDGNQELIKRKKINSTNDSISENSKNLTSSITTTNNLTNDSNISPNSSKSAKLKNRRTFKIKPKNPRVSIGYFLNAKAKVNQKRKKEKADANDSKSTVKVRNHADDNNKSVEDKDDWQAVEQQLISENGGTPKKKKTGTKKKSNRKSLNVTTNGRKQSLNNKTDNLNKKNQKPSPWASLQVNSIDKGKELFAWIIDPIPIDDFMNHNWESKPMLIQRKSVNYYGDLLSIDGFYRMFCEHHVEFTKNLDVTTYKNGIRETLNPDGRALPPIVRDFYNDGCSLRLLNPQTFLPKIYALNATLQEYFHCMIGANVYITPPNSQGFAPHYDDIEAFVLQIEGKKHWKLYKPRTPGEYLPQISSDNLKQSEIGEPILDVILEPGDLLYFPRGTIHQAVTVPGFHSLHITVSVYQRQSYADLLEILLPMALQQAKQQDVIFRQGVPLNIWQNIGFVYSDQESKERETILRHIHGLLSTIFERYLPIDAAVDRMAIRYQHDALPPLLTTIEKSHTVYGASAIKTIEITGNSSVRLIRANILRLLKYDEELRVYYYTDNSKEYHQYDVNYLQITAEDGPAIDLLVKMYPNYLKVKQLQLESTARNVSVAQDLWERGLLLVRK